MASRPKRAVTGDSKTDCQRFHIVQKLRPMETPPGPGKKIVPREQIVRGRVSALQSGSVTTFLLRVPARSDFARLTGLKVITVYQVSATTLEDVRLKERAMVMVRGLLFTDGDTLKMVAKRIAKP